jgi:hypothetical protein
MLCHQTVNCSPAIYSSSIGQCPGLYLGHHPHLAISEVDDNKITQIVESSNAAARKIVRPGIKAEIDLAARSVIEEAGWRVFIHRTGHGAGMEG